MPFKILTQIYFCSSFAFNSVLINGSFPFHYPLPLCSLYYKNANKINPGISWALVRAAEKARAETQPELSMKESPRAVHLVRIQHVHYLGEWRNSHIKKKIFECIIDYGDHLLITENPEDPVRVMEVWNRQSLTLLSSVCVCGHTGVGGAYKGAMQIYVSLLDNGQSCCICIHKVFPLKLCVVSTNSVWSQSLTTFVGLWVFL